MARNPPASISKPTSRIQGLPKRVCTTPNHITITAPEISTNTNNALSRPRHHTALRYRPREEKLLAEFPQPPTAPGITWRPAALADAAGLADHSRRIHEAERLDFLPGEDFMRWLLSQPGLDPAADMLVAESSGSIVADAGVWTHGGDQGARCFIWGEAGPGHEDLKPFLIAWAEARARQRLSEFADGLDRIIRVAVEEHRSAHRRVIEQAGFAVTRTFVEMVRPLTDLPTAPPLPHGVGIAPWTGDLDDDVRMANNESFADHWGSLPMAPEEWASLYRQSPTFRPDLSFVALSQGEVVSFCLSEVDEEDNADRDTDDVYIQRVGTRKNQRGRGLASHLIVRSLEAAWKTGELNRAALEVDEMSHTNATVVYERLGFSTSGRSMHYTKRL